MTAEQLQPDDLPMSDDAKRAMALELISDEIAYSPPFGGALHVWRWVKEEIVAASTAPTAQLREADTEQFEQVMTALVTAVIDHQSSQGHTWNHFVPDCPQVIAARAALLSLFSKAAGAPTRAEGETVDPEQGLTAVGALLVDDGELLDRLEQWAHEAAVIIRVDHQGTIALSVKDPERGLAFVHTCAGPTLRESIAQAMQKDAYVKCRAHQAALHGAASNTAPVGTGEGGQ